MTTNTHQFTQPSISHTHLDANNYAGHGDHWGIFGVDSKQIKAWLSQSLETATVPAGLGTNTINDKSLLIASNEVCHIKQVFAMEDGKPTDLLNVFPAVASPYGLDCVIERVLACQETADAILQLQTPDGTTIYAYDTLYATNAVHYQPQLSYYVNFGAWAYVIKKSNTDEVVVVDDPKAIRYHRAFNDIVANNNGVVPDDIDTKIKNWTPNTDEPLAPVEINLGHSCIYLYGEAVGQEDEAWCQGQVLGKSKTHFFDQDMTLFDVVILREQDSKPFVVRIAALTTKTTEDIQVNDYIQANIWLQSAIYQKTQLQSS